MSAFDLLMAEYRDVAALEATLQLLGWDQQVFMPTGGAGARAAHSQVLKRMVHERLTSSRLQDLVGQALADAEPGSIAEQSVRALQRDIEVLIKLPLELVERKAKVSSEAYEAWRIAKPANEFKRMAPYYEELFSIARETADAIGYETHPYDALIGLYEYGATHADAVAMFEAIKAPIIDLVQRIRESGFTIDDSRLRQPFRDEEVLAFARHAAATIGFDFERGRLDICRNAFCTNLGRSDVRMTTRPSSHIKGIVSSSLHEMGHGLYEQGSAEEFEGTPLAGGISLAVHESQSRTWENIVGRSRAFWRYFLPALQSHVSGLAGVSGDEMARMMNRVQPEFVRVGADELTYNLHILIRFELEAALITGELQIRDLPEAWNDRYEAYLGIRPATNTDGCLQDVHWCRGSIGYFPTYSMGNLIGAQIWETMQSEIGPAEARIEAGEFAPILEWLQAKVYRQGRRYEPRELVQRVTGKSLDANAWLNYATAKYGDLYGLIE